MAEVIVIDSEAFYKLMDDILAKVKQPEKERWILEEDAKKLLGVKSKSTMQELRNGGKIRFSQPRKKIILYDRESILQFIDDHAKDTF